MTATHRLGLSHSTAKHDLANAIEAAAGSQDGGRELDRPRHEVATWAASLGAIVGGEAGSGLADRMLADLRKAAAPVRKAAAPTILYAAAALREEDRVSEAHAVGLRPWVRARAARKG